MTVTNHGPLLRGSLPPPVPRRNFPYNANTTWYFGWPRHRRALQPLEREHKRKLGVKNATEITNVETQPIQTEDNARRENSTCATAACGFAGIFRPRVSGRRRAPRRGRRSNKKPPDPCQKLLCTYLEPHSEAEMSKMVQRMVVVWISNKWTTFVA